MKHLLLTLGAGVLLTACAGVRVTEVQTAAVVTERPKSIYIRPFSIEGGEFAGHHEGGEGQKALHQSLAPAEFSTALKEELEKLGPARILAPDEVATEGWLVTGSVDVVNGGSPVLRGVAPGPLGRSHIAIHVKVQDLDGRSVAVSEKDGSALHRRGRVIYEFDVAGGSRWSGKPGSPTAPAFGYAGAVRLPQRSGPHPRGARARPASVWSAHFHQRPVARFNASSRREGELQPGAGEP